MRTNKSAKVQPTLWQYHELHPNFQKSNSWCGVSSDNQVMKDKWSSCSCIRTTFYTTTWTISENKTLHLNHFRGQNTMEPIFLRQTLIKQGTLRNMVALASSTSLPQTRLHKSTKQILVSWSVVTTASQYFHTSLWLTIMHHHIEFGNKRFSGS